MTRVATLSCSATMSATITSMSEKARCGPVTSSLIPARPARCAGSRRTLPGRHLGAAAGLPADGDSRPGIVPSVRPAPDRPMAAIRPARPAGVTPGVVTNRIIPEHAGPLILEAGRRRAVCLARLPVPGQPIRARNLLNSAAICSPASSCTKCDAWAAERSGDILNWPFQNVKGWSSHGTAEGL